MEGGGVKGDPGGGQEALRGRAVIVELRTRAGCDCDRVGMESRIPYNAGAQLLRFAARFGSW
jgi:hypothetical protein